MGAAFLYLDALNLQDILTRELSQNIQELTVVTDGRRLALQLLPIDIA